MKEVLKVTRERSGSSCQYSCLVNAAEPRTTWESIVRQARFAKRTIVGFPIPRHRRLASMIKTSRLFEGGGVSTQQIQASIEAFQPGDVVWVRQREEIGRTLDHNNMLKGCQFMPEMYQYCGTRQVVYKSVRKFLDEGEKIMRRAKNIYLLADVMCCGTHGFEECDRSCFFFWRGEWLQKLSNTSGSNS